MRPIHNVMLTLVFALTLGAAACGPSKATPEECAAACDNVGKLAAQEAAAQGAADDYLGPAGEPAMALLQDTAKTMVANVKSACEQECAAKGTQPVAACLATAESVAAAEACPIPED